MLFLKYLLLKVNNAIIAQEIATETTPLTIKSHAPPTDIRLQTKNETAQTTAVRSIFANIAGR